MSDVVLEPQKRLSLLDFLRAIWDPKCNQRFKVVSHFGIHAQKRRGVPLKLPGISSTKAPSPWHQVETLRSFLLSCHTKYSQPLLQIPLNVFDPIAHHDQSVTVATSPVAFNTVMTLDLFESLYRLSCSFCADSTEPHGTIVLLTLVFNQGFQIAQAPIWLKRPNRQLQQTPEKRSPLLALHHVGTTRFGLFDC